MSIIVASMLSLSSASLSNAHSRKNWNAAFFHAENAMQWAAQQVADLNPAASNYYSTANGLLALPYMAAAESDPANGFKSAWVSVVRTNVSFPDNYLVTASARVGDKVRTLQATVIKNPPSQIFDYEYFLNNWGWWWGRSITGNGGNNILAGLAGAEAGTELNRAASEGGGCRLRTGAFAGGASEVSRPAPRISPASFFLAPAIVYCSS
jgi:hypothetical protein